MMHTPAALSDHVAARSAAGLRDQLRWQCDWDLCWIAADGAVIETRHIPGNLLVTAGLSALADRLIGGATSAFSTANAHIGIGNSTTAAALGQTDLQGASTYRQAMDATYPQISGGVITFRATIPGNQGNFAIEEIGIFNASSGGTMLNRKVQSLGTKASGVTLEITATITLANA